MYSTTTHTYIGIALIYGNYRLSEKVKCLEMSSNTNKYSNYMVGSSRNKATSAFRGTTTGV